MSARPLTVSITTRNRPAALERCLRSLASIRKLVDGAIVLDDASVPPVDVEGLTRTAEAAGIRLEVLRHDVQIGTAAGKNAIARRARAPYLLSLDDDACLVGDGAVRQALAVLQQDARVAAVAFAQADEHGVPYAAAQQPSAALTACYVPAFIGFGCLIARDRLLEIGGYREAFVIHGEEREVCLRWLDRGLNVVYLPDAPVAHLADAANRDPRAYIRHVMRNDCLASLYNDPLLRAVVVIPYKLWSFTRMRATLAGGDRGGLRWIVGELVRSAPAVLRQRRPVRWRTLREWRRLRELSPAYQRGRPQAADLATPRLTIGITTRNRPDALSTCLESLEVLADLDPEVIVFDDGSDPPASVPPIAGLSRVRTLRDETSPGYIVGRNRMVSEASAPAVLLLDDDTQLLSREQVEGALAVLERDPRVAAIGFAQSEADGTPWPAGMQPSPVAYACIVPSFIGFAHLLRRDVFLALGGYRERFIFDGAEKEFCLRLLDAGYWTVYLPGAGIAHLPRPATRSRTRHLRFVVRNDCLNALYNDPIPRLLWMLPARFLVYFRMRRGWAIDDPWGWLWVARDLMRELPQALRQRRPVSWTTLRTWRALRHGPVPYAEPVNG